MDKWSKKQVQQLYESISLYPVTLKDYWVKVSENVENKTSQQCQEKYQKLNKKRKGKEEEEVKIESVLNIKGKITKKRMIRNILKKADSEHFDDFFEKENIKKKVELDSSFNEKLFESKIPKSEEIEEKEDLKILIPVNMNEIDTYLNKIKKIPKEKKKIKREINRNVFKDLEKEEEEY